MGSHVVPARPSYVLRRVRVCFVVFLVSFRDADLPSVPRFVRVFRSFVVFFSFGGPRETHGSFAVSSRVTKPFVQVHVRKTNSFFVVVFFSPFRHHVFLSSPPGRSRFVFSSVLFSFRFVLLFFPRVPWSWSRHAPLSTYACTYRSSSSSWSSGRARTTLHPRLAFFHFLPSATTWFLPPFPWFHPDVQAIRHVHGMVRPAHVVVVAIVAFDTTRHVQHDGLVSLPQSLSIPLPQSLSPSLSLTLNLCHSIPLTLTLSVNLSPSLSLTLSHPHLLSIAVAISVTISRGGSLSEDLARDVRVGVRDTGKPPRSRSLCGSPTVSSLPRFVSVFVPISRSHQRCSMRTESSFEGGEKRHDRNKRKGETRPRRRRGNDEREKGRKNEKTRRGKGRV